MNHATRGLPSDEEFRRLAQRSPDTAVEIVVRAMGGQLRGYLKKVLPNPEDADDCLQETAIRLMQDVPSYDGKVPVRQWVYLRARWTAQKMCQKVARKADSVYRQSGAESSGRPLDAAEYERAKEAVAAFLETLPLPKRQLLEMRFLGWTHEEIGAEYEMSPVAVRKAYSRILSDIRRAIGQ